MLSTVVTRAHLPHGAVMAVVDYGLVISDDATAMAIGVAGALAIMHVITRAAIPVPLVVRCAGAATRAVTRIAPRDLRSSGAPMRTQKKGHRPAYESVAHFVA